MLLTKQESKEAIGFTADQMFAYRLSTCEQGTQFRRVSEAIAKIDEVLK